MSVSVQCSGLIVRSSRLQYVFLDKPSLRYRGTEAQPLIMNCYPQVWRLWVNVDEIADKEAYQDWPLLHSHGHKAEVEQ